MDNIITQGCYDTFKLPEVKQEIEKKPKKPTMKQIFKIKRK